MRNKTLTIVTLGAMLTLGSCNRDKVYSHYVHIESAQWEKTDTVHFYIPHLKETGTYRGSIGLRIDNDFPYQKLALEVSTEILPEEQFIKHSFNCDIIDKHGTIKGSGISHYQYDFPTDVLHLKEGDSVHVTVIHNMKREIMPSICDVGFTVTKE